MRLFYSKRRFLKKFLRACITLFMSISIVCCSVVAPCVSMPVRTEASAVLVGKIATYILSALGAVNIGTGGRVSKVAGSKFDGLVEMVSDAMGQGVYTDSQGNYVFSNEFSQNVLSYLDGQTDLNYRVLSDFSAPSNWNGVFENSQYVSPEFFNAWRNYRSTFSNYICVMCGYGSNPSDYYASSFVYYDMTEVSCICISNGAFLFYDSSLNRIYPECYGMVCAYIGYRNRFNNSSIFHSSGAGLCYLYITSSSETSINSVMLRDIPVDNTAFVSYPFYSSSNNNFELDSNRSVILCKSSGIGSQVVNKDSGIFINNYYTNIPSVSPNVVENNNWDSIYNNYVTNVTNNYYEDNGEDNSFDQTKLRKWMSKYSEQIIEAIQNGDENIAEQLNYTNEWLKKIYNRLGIIENIISDSNSGSSAVVSGGSSSWSDNDVSTILSDVNNIRSLLSDNNTYLYSLQNRIDTTNETLSGASAVLNLINTNTFNTVTQLQNLYTLLSNVYTAILNIDSGGGGGGGSVVPLPDSDPYSDWFEVLHNIPQVDLDDMFDKFDVLKAVLQNTAPFVMLGIITVTLNSFKAEPVVPEFSIPVKLQNDIIDIDESIELDLSVLDTLIPLLRDLILILWTIGLLMFAWWLIPKIYIIIN